jgi:hypothetical protein
MPSITQFVQGRPSELVFNLDKVGIFGWEDRTGKSVIVRKSMCEQVIYGKVNRNIKHMLITACISAAGESLTPYIVTSQDMPSVREQLKNAACTMPLISF